jgi:hypothetical protein
MEVKIVVMVDMGRAASRAAARAALPVVSPFARMINASKHPAVSQPVVKPVVNPFARNKSILNPPFKKARYW